MQKAEGPGFLLSMDSNMAAAYYLARCGNEKFICICSELK